MIPYVDVLIDRYSSSAPLRAASERMRAWLGQLRRQEIRARLTLLMMIPPRLCATKIIGRCVVYHGQSRLQLLLSRHRSDTSCVAWSYRYWQLTRSSCVSHRIPSRRRAHSGCRPVGDRGASGCRSLPSTSCRGVHSSHGQRRCWELSVRALVMLRMAYSTTGCSLSATTLRPWAGASEGSFGFNEVQ